MLSKHGCVPTAEQFPKACVIPFVQEQRPWGMAKLRLAGYFVHVRLSTRAVLRVCAHVRVCVVCERRRLLG